MRKIFFYGTILILILMLFSCKNNKLTRQKAEKMIVEKLQLPTDFLLYYGTTDYFYNRYNKVDITPISNEIELGLAERANTTFIGRFYQVTEAGEKYIARNIFKKRNMNDIYKDDIKYLLNGQYLLGEYMVAFRAAKLNFGEITGIQENESKITVEYNLRLTEVTPFGKCVYSDNLRRFIQENDIIPRKAYFEKYDDGWRISN